MFLDSFLGWIRVVALIKFMGPVVDGLHVLVAETLHDKGLIANGTFNVMV